MLGSLLATECSKLTSQRPTSHSLLSRQPGVLAIEPSWLLCTILVTLTLHMVTRALRAILYIFGWLTLSWLPSVLAYLFGAILTIQCPLDCFCALLATQHLPDSSGHSWLFVALLATRRSSGYLALFSMLSALLSARHPASTWMQSCLFVTHLASRPLSGRSATSWPLVGLFAA